MSVIDATVSIFGHVYSSPIHLSPIAYHKFANVKGEVETRRGAELSNAIMVHSCWSHTSIEDYVAGATRPHSLWQNVYLWDNWAKVEQIVRRVEQARMGAIVVTIDNQIYGRKSLAFNPYEVLQRQVCNRFSSCKLLQGEAAII